MLISIVVNGLTSYHLFKVADYDLSSLLIVASYLSMVLGIFVITARKSKSSFIK